MEAINFGEKISAITDKQIDRLLDSFSIELKIKQKILMKY
jgi:hypothetical protein